MIFGYARCSTDDQAKGTTLSEQERKNRAIATLRGAQAFDFSSYVDDGVSGSIPLSERPEGAKMLAVVRKGDTIVCTKLDRMFRSTLDALRTAEDFKKRGIDLILADLGSDPITHNGVSRLIFGIMAQIADFERERIGERMRDGRSAKKAKGGHIAGSAPFGFRVVGEGRDARLEPDTEEQDVIQLAKAIHQTHGFKRPYRVAKVLNEMGVRSRAGGELQTVQIERWFKREQTVG